MALPLKRVLLQVREGQSSIYFTCDPERPRPSESSPSERRDLNVGTDQEWTTRYGVRLMCLARRCPAYVDTKVLRLRDTTTLALRGPGRISEILGSDKRYQRHLIQISLSTIVIWIL